MKRLTLLLLAGLLPFAANACLNEYRHTNELELTADLAELDKNMIRHFDRDAIAAELQGMLKRGLDDYKDSSDAAVLLIKNGEVFHALGMFQLLMQAHPAEYTIASNLGTAYELAGENDSALKYIRLGMKLNPKSHRGSEWVHERILKTKLALADDPRWLEWHTALDLSHHMFREEMDFGKNTGRGMAQVDTLTAIIYQLNERIPFTSAPDLIMASITSDLAAILWLGTPGLSMKYYALADEYAGGMNASIRQSHRELLQRKEKESWWNDLFAASLPLPAYDSTKVYTVTDGKPAQGFTITTPAEKLALADSFWQATHAKKEKKPAKAAAPTKRGYTRWFLAGILVLCTFVFLAIKRKTSV
jgi:hypothetical protein